MRKIAVAYVPVLHRGYKEFLEEVGKDTEVFILGEELISRFDYLRKEIRALSPVDVCQIVSSLGFRCRVLSEDVLRSLRDESLHIFASNEDVTRDILKEEFPKAEVTYLPIFLRWHRDNVLANREVNPDRQVDASSLELLISASLAEKELSSDWWRQVGAVAFREGEVLLSAHNTHLPSPHTPWTVGDPRNVFNRGLHIGLGSSIHAELSVITLAAKGGVALEGAELFVTDFPCPGCSKAIAHSGIVRVYYAEGYAVLDGLEVLRSFGVEVVQVTGIEYSSDLNRSLPYPQKK